MIYTVKETERGMRLDAYAAEVAEITRSAAARLIEEGAITVSGAAQPKKYAVKVGDEVTANQTLCIVEAMKLMNEIGSPEMGIVREVCVQDGDPVEYGTVLFYIEPITSGAGTAPETA